MQPRVRGMSITRRQEAFDLRDDPYGKRFRACERVSPSLAESTVNAVISKRFARGCCGQNGARICCYRSACALDGTPRPLFEQWYRGLLNDSATGAAMAAGA